MKSEYEMRVTTQYSYNEGKADGRAEGRAETARAMLAEGVDPAIVAKYSDLPPAYSAGSQEKK